MASEHFLQENSWKTFQIFWHLPRSIGVELSEFQLEQVPFKKIAVPFPTTEGLCAHSEPILNWQVKCISIPCCDNLGVTFSIQLGF